MLNFKMLKPAGAIIRKIGVGNLIDEFEKIDLEQKDAQTAFGMKLFSLVCENLEHCADNVIELCAAYRGATFEEMSGMDPFEVLPEIFREKSLGNFIKPLLARAASKRA